MKNGKNIQDQSMKITDLPNHVNNHHVHVYRWLDGCGWSIDCGPISVRELSLEDVIARFLEITKGLEIRSEWKGFGLVGKIGEVNKEVTKSYFY